MSAYQLYELYLRSPDIELTRYNWYRYYVMTIEPVRHYLVMCILGDQHCFPIDHKNNIITILFAAVQWT